MAKFPKNIQPEEFKDPIIFMSMFNDVESKKDDENCISNAEEVRHYAMRFSQGHWTFVGTGSEERSGMAILLTLKRSNGIAQPITWYSDSKKLVILSSKVPVL